jgi:transcriptional regulator with XRE-family HTH domain
MFLQSIDTRVAERLRDREFRREWFRAELEQNVPAMFRDLREERGLTQTDLADLVEMKQSAVSRFEKSAEPKWKFETLLRLAEALDAQLVVSLLKAEDVIKHYEEEEARATVESTAAERATSSAPATRSILEGSSIYEVTWHSGDWSNQPLSGGLIDRGAGNLLRRREGGRTISVQESPFSAGAGFREERVRTRSLQESAHQ